MKPNDAIEIVGGDCQLADAINICAPHPKRVWEIRQLKHGFVLSEAGNSVTGQRMRKKLVERFGLPARSRGVRRDGCWSFDCMGRHVPYHYISGSWVNLGDMNPREWGGYFVRPTGFCSADVIRTINCEDTGIRNGHTYGWERTMVEREDYESRGASVMSSCGYKTLREVPLLSFAVDFISTYGPDNGEIFFHDNFYKMLREAGIYSWVQ